MYDAKQALSAFSKAAIEHAPTILTWISVLGVGVCVCATAKQAPKIRKTLEKKKEELGCVREGDEETRNVVIKETVKEVAKEAAPVAAAVTVTVASIIASNRISNNRILDLKDSNAALVATCLATDKAFESYKKAAGEILEKKDLEKIDEKVVENDIRRAKEEQGGYPMLPPNAIPGLQLWYDRATDQFFYSTLDRILRVKDQYNNMLKGGYDEFISQNTLLKDLGEHPTSHGDILGFNSYDGGDSIYKEPVDIRYWSDVDEDAGLVVGYIDYTVKERHSYGGR